MRPSHKALSLSARLPPSHPAICYMGRSALSLWTDSTPPPAKNNDSVEFTQSEWPDWSVRICVRVRCTLSQYHPALTPSLSCPMVTLLRGLRSEAISTLKMSVRPRSNFPPAKNTWKHISELIYRLSSKHKHTVRKGRFYFFTISGHRVIWKLSVVIVSPLGNELCLISVLHGWTNTEKQTQRLIKRNKMHQNFPHCLLDLLLLGISVRKHQKQHQSNTKKAWTTTWTNVSVEYKHLLQTVIPFLN